MTFREWLKPDWFGPAPKWTTAAMEVVYEMELFMLSVGFSAYSFICYDTERVFILGGAIGWATALMHLYFERKFQKLNDEAVVILHYAALQLDKKYRRVKA